MRLPGRLHITWQDESTLKIETDTGMQTRLLHFGGKPSENLAPSRQGYSAAQWEQPERGIGAAAAGIRGHARGNERQGAGGRHDSSAARLPSQERIPGER